MTHVALFYSLFFLVTFKRCDERERRACGQQNSLFAKRRQRLSYSSPTHHRRFFFWTCVCVDEGVQPTTFQGCFFNRRSLLPTQEREREGGIAMHTANIFSSSFFPFLLSFLWVFAQSGGGENGIPPSPSHTSPASKPQKEGFLTERRREKNP